MSDKETTEGNASRECRLPQIDPITFSALTLLDGFVARAALTRQEHAEANRSLQHIVQTIEVLQAQVREFSVPSPRGATNVEAPFAGSLPGAEVQNGMTPRDVKVPAAEAEEVFRRSRLQR